MHQSTSSDFLIRLKNASLAGHKSIVTPSSKFCVSLADVLKKSGFVTAYEVETDGSHQNLKIAFSDTPISEVQLFSKPGRRLYSKHASIPWGKTPGSLIIVSTSQGLMSQKQAVAKKLGGELIAEIY